MCFPTKHATVCCCQFIINITGTKFQRLCSENNPNLHRPLKDNHEVLGKYSL